MTTDDFRLVLCERCGGEGKLYTSRYGGNDPDVWPVGECPVCEGTGHEMVEVEPIELDDLSSLTREEAISDLAREKEMRDG